MENALVNIIKECWEVKLHDQCHTRLRLIYVEHSHQGIVSEMRYLVNQRVCREIVPIVHGYTVLIASQSPPH